MIETLTLFSTILTAAASIAEEEPPNAALRMDDMAGLNLMILCVKAAAESCYAQCAQAAETTA